MSSSGSERLTRLDFTTVVGFASLPHMFILFLRLKWQQQHKETSSRGDGRDAREHDPLHNNIPSLCCTMLTKIPLSKASLMATASTLLWWEGREVVNIFEQ